MAEDKSKKPEQLQDEQLDEAAGGAKKAPEFEKIAPTGNFL